MHVPAFLDGKFDWAGGGGGGGGGVCLSGPLSLSGLEFLVWRISFWLEAGPQAADDVFDDASGTMFCNDVASGSFSGTTFASVFSSMPLLPENDDDGFSGSQAAHDGKFPVITALAGGWKRSTDTVIPKKSWLSFLMPRSL